MPASHGDQNIAEPKLAGGDEVAIVTIDIHFTAPLLDDQDFGGANQVPLDGQMRVARDLTVGGVHDVPHLQAAIVGRQVPRLRWRRPGAQNVRQDNPRVGDRFHHAAPPRNASTRWTTSPNARRKSRCSSKKAHAPALKPA